MIRRVLSTRRDPIFFAPLGWQSGRNAVSESAFSTDAQSVDVRFERRDAPLERLISDRRNVPGIYALVVGGNVVRV